MKKAISLISTMFLSLILFAQDSPVLDGFWNIEWGTEKNRAVYLMKLKGCSVVDDADRIVTLTGSFIDEPAIFYLTFCGGKQLSMATVVFNYQGSNAVFRYDNIQRLLVEKYGKPAFVHRDFKIPYKDGDGNEEAAIVMGMANISSIWTFPNKDTITIFISDKLGTILVYQNYILSLLDQAVIDDNKKQDL